MTVNPLPSPDQGGLSAQLSDLRCLYRRHGLRETAAKAAGRVSAIAYSREELVVLAKDLTDVSSTTFDGTLRMDELTAAHLPALYEFNRRRCDSKANARCMEDVRRGYRGYVAFHEEQLVGYYWWVDREIEANHRDIANYGLGIELGEHDVYGYDFFLLEEHRGGGNSTQFLAGVESRLSELGYRTLWGYVVADNKPARWTYSMRRYRSIRTVGGTRVLNRRVGGDRPLPWRRGAENTAESTTVGEA